MQPRVAQPIIRGLLLVIALPYFQVHAQLPSSRTISNCQIGPGQATTQSTPITRLSFKMAVAPAPTTMTSPAQDKSKDVDPGLAMVFSMALGEGTNKLVVEVTKFNHTRCGRSPTDWCIALAHINPPNHPHFSPGVPWNGHLDTLTFEALATGDDATKPSWHFRLTNSWPPFLATLTFIDVPQGPPMTKVFNQVVFYDDFAGTSPQHTFHDIDIDLLKADAAFGNTVKHLGGGECKFKVNPVLDDLHWHIANLIVPPLDAKDASKTA